MLAVEGLVPITSALAAVAHAGRQTEKEKPKETSKIDDCHYIAIFLFVDPDDTSLIAAYFS